ncbi:histidine phosphatase family protein [Nocardioides sp.]|uniref:histidine phosphatase family protein n=1 Tax=Nocardioides sp. TaxID=35761 RepID=UPI0035167918
MGRLLLVRHGQASFGAADYDVLSPTGWEQGRALGRWLAARGVVPTSIVRGDLARHRDTLAAMREGAGESAAAGWPTEVVDADWNEFDHVALVAAAVDLLGPEHAGRDHHTLSRREFQDLFERATARWSAGEPGDYPETWNDFTGRVQRALGLAAEDAGSGRTVVVVTSGGPIGVCAAHLADPEDPDPAGLARRWQRFNTVAVNTGVTPLVVGGTGVRMLGFNDHAHLDDALRTYR